MFMKDTGDFCLVREVLASVDISGKAAQGCDANV
jgi:hypothetical protein